MAAVFDDRNMTIGINETGNETTGNITAAVAKPLDVRSNVIILVTVCVAMLIKIPGCVSLFYSIRIPFHIRYVNLSFIIGILTLDVCLILLQILILVYGFQYMILHDLRSVLPNVFTVISWASIAHLAINRLLFVTRPIFHRDNITRPKVLLMILFNWFQYPVIAVSVYIYSDPLPAQNQLLDSNMVVNIRIVTSICYAFYNGVAVLAYIFLQQFFTRLVRNTLAVSKRNYSSTRVLISITIASSLLQSPNALVVLVFDILGFTHPIRGFLRMITFILLLASMVINTFLFIWKLQECQYHFMRVFLCCFGKYKVKAKDLRSKIYSINNIASG